MIVKTEQRLRVNLVECSLFVLSLYCTQGAYESQESQQNIIKIQIAAYTKSLSPCSNNDATAHHIFQH